MALMARSRAASACEPGQVREEAALSDTARAPRASRAGVRTGANSRRPASTEGARSSTLETVDANYRRPAHRDERGRRRVGAADHWVRSGQMCQAEWCEDR